MYVNSVVHRYILGTRVDVLNYDGAAQIITGWARARQSKYVCAANVQMVMEAYKDDYFSRVVNSADLVSADGMPLVWLLRKMGIADATRVYGPDLMHHVCAAAQLQEIPVGFFGGHGGYLEPLIHNMRARYPTLKINYAYSPPFSDLDPAPDEQIINSINASGVRILFVSLGCPKQERWMLRHKGRIQAVMLGVGAAFDFVSGRVRQAPHWMQNNGMEWLFRLSQDPKRLFARYIRGNPHFVLLVLLHRLGMTSARRTSRAPRLSSRH